MRLSVRFANQPVRMPIPTGNVVAEDAGKLKALRAAARVGVGALDRGEFKEFRNVEGLQAYLNDLSEAVICKTSE
jgi:antitoxin ParD1/3/4